LALLCFAFLGLLCFALVVFALLSFACFAPDLAPEPMSLWENWLTHPPGQDH
jgi:hypothetical protein